MWGKLYFLKIAANLQHDASVSYWGWVYLSISSNWGGSCDCTDQQYESDPIPLQSSLETHLRYFSWKSTMTYKLQLLWDDREALEDDRPMCGDQGAGGTEMREKPTEHGGYPLVTTGLKLSAGCRTLLFKYSCSVRTKQSSDSPVTLSRSAWDTNHWCKKTIIPPSEPWPIFSKRVNVYKYPYLKLKGASVRWD